MGTSKKHKEESREAIISAASRLFREHGIDGVSVSDIMSEAGLTHGGFPRHFASKQDLVAHSLASALADKSVETQLTGESFPDFARRYLSVDHRDHPGQGCVFAALAAEVARSSPEVRQVMTDALQTKLDSIAPTSDDTERATAIGNWATLIGGIMLARLSTSHELSDEILASTRSYVGI